MDNKQPKPDEILAKQISEQAGATLKRDCSFAASKENSGGLFGNPTNNKSALFAGSSPGIFSNQGGLSSGALFGSPSNPNGGLFANVSVSGIFSNSDNNFGGGLFGSSVGQSGSLFGKSELPESSLSRDQEPSFPRAKTESKGPQKQKAVGLFGPLPNDASLESNVSKTNSVSQADKEAENKALSNTGGVLKLNSLGSNQIQEHAKEQQQTPSFLKKDGAMERVAPRSRNQVLKDKGCFVRSITALSSFYGKFSKEQLRIKHIQGGESSPLIIINEADILPKNIFKNLSNFKPLGSLFEPYDPSAKDNTSNNQKKQVPLPPWFLMPAKVSQPQKKSVSQLPQPKSLKNVEIEKIQKPIAQKLHLLEDIKDVDPDLQVYLPQLLSSLQATQSLADKVATILLQANIAVKDKYPPQKKKSDKQVFSYALPLLGDFCVFPPIQALETMEAQELKGLKNVRIWNSFGQIEFLEPISLFEADLEETLRISQDKIQVSKSGLSNKRVRMTFRNFGLFTNLKGEQRQAMLRRMRKWIGKCQMRQISHDQTTGDLVVETD